MIRHREWNPNQPIVPIDKDGNWIAYPTNNCKWESVTPFEAEFEIAGMETGRSAKRVVLRDVKTDKTYPMFVGDLINGIKKGDFDVIGLGNQAGRLSGTWTASKRGANYGIRAVRS